MARRRNLPIISYLNPGTPGIGGATTARPPAYLHQPACLRRRSPRYSRTFPIHRI
jgi:hypothetical protein